MPNYLVRSLGETGKVLEKSSQDYVVKHLYIREGACLSICTKFMCEIKNINIPTEKEYVEAAQWIQGAPNVHLRVTQMVNAAGLKQAGFIDGSLDRDEISIAPFLEKISAKPSFNIFSFLNTQRTTGHAILIYQWAGDDWMMKDPNFGMATWPNVNGLLVGLKKLLRNGYSDFGPYYRFGITKYE